MKKTNRKSRDTFNLTPQDALFFDLDGTLIEIAAKPEDVRIPDDIRAVFNTLSLQRSGAVAIITGRDMDFVDQVFGAGNIAASASHGAVIRRAPGAETEDLAPRPDFRLLDRLIAETRPPEMPEGIWVEKKDFACALHFRGAVADSSEQVSERVGAWAAAICETYNRNVSASGRLSLTRGDMVMELGPAAVDKGTVLDAFMMAAPFKGRRPVFFGDSFADVPGMEAARRTRNGDTGRAVAVGEQVASHADAIVDTPHLLRQFLRRQI